MIYIDELKKKEIDNLVYTDITRRQFKLALLSMDLLDVLETGIKNIPDKKTSIRVGIEYEEASTVVFNSDLAKEYQHILKMSEKEFKDFWKLALDQ